MSNASLLVRHTDYGLRDYGTARWEGGDPECDHVQNYNLKRDASGGVGGGRIYGTRGEQPSSSSSKIGYRDICGKCGARRVDAQIGLEQSPEAYIAKIVEVFREVWRVLRPSGTVWLNLGDSYAGSGGAGGDYNEGGLKEGQPRYKSNFEIDKSKRKNGRWGGGNLPATGALKPEDLIMIPAQVALALRADGWWLRSEIIWNKLNPMPESCRDRPTKSHEYIFLLTKSPFYYYDSEAIREDSAPSSQERSRYNGGNPSPKNLQGVGEGIYCGPMSTAKAYGQGRNKRSVWTIPTEAYSGSHFAVFPRDLVRPCILAGSSPRACEKCGAPWERVVEIERVPYPRKNGPGGRQALGDVSPSSCFNTNLVPRSTTLGWRATCKCDSEGKGRCIVLDPFCGTGTVGMIAGEYGRDFVGLELNPAYIPLALERTEQARLQKVMPMA